MKIDYLTRAMIRSIERNATGEFELPTRAACNSARTQVTHVHNIDGTQYKTHVDYKERKVYITRLR